MKGDAILVDLDRVARDPWIDPEFEIADAFVERAMGADVATVSRAPIRIFRGLLWRSLSLCS